jgi:tetratricopeptide (TPR) repeat protein
MDSQMPEIPMQETPTPDMTGIQSAAAIPKTHDRMVFRPCPFFLAKRTYQCSQLALIFRFYFPFLRACNNPPPFHSEPLLQTVPQLNAAILQLAQHADRETAMFANMALTFLVQPVANKISLKDAGLLDFLRTASKSKDPELVAYAANIMANWAFELPAATLKFSAEQRDILKNSLMQMAEMFVSTGLHEAAFLALQELQKLEPNEPFWNNLLGKILSTLKRHDEANVHFRACIRGNPAIVEAAHMLAQNLVLHGGAAGKVEAVGVLRTALESVQVWPAALSSVVSVGGGSRIRTHQTVTKLNVAMHAHVCLIVLPRTLYCCLPAPSDPSDPLISAPSAPPTHPLTPTYTQTYHGVPDMHLLLADALHSSGKWAAAVAAVDAAIQRDARVKRGSAAHARLLLTKGRALFRLGDLAAAEKALSESVKLLAADARAHYHLAHVLDHMKRHDDALLRIDDALRLNPELAAAHFLKGRLHAQKQQWAEAATAFAAFTELKPNAPEGWYQLAQAQSHGGSASGSSSGNAQQYQSLTKALQSWQRVCQASGNCGRFFVQHPTDMQTVMRVRAMAATSEAQATAEGREMAAAADELVALCG